MTLLEKYRQQHQGKSEYDLVVIREQARSGTEEHQVVTALLHEKQIQREEAAHRKTRLIAWLALGVAVLSLVLQFFDGQKSDAPTVHTATDSPLLP